MVDKLGLICTINFHFYKLQLSHEYGEVEVSKQVSFIIGWCTDEVLYDVLLMHASHLLVGWWWEKERRAFHDGLRNHYSFSMNRWNHALTSLPPEEAFKDQLKIKKTLDENMKCEDQRIKKNDFTGVV